MYPLALFVTVTTFATTTLPRAASTPGGVGSYVWGCTDFDRRPVETDNGNGGGSGGNTTGSSSDGTRPSRQVVPVLAALALVAAGLFV
jgi:hypothetical protein